MGQPHPTQTNSRHACGHCTPVCLTTLSQRPASDATPRTSKPSTMHSSQLVMDKIYAHVTCLQQCAVGVSVACNRLDVLPCCHMCNICGTDQLEQIPCCMLCFCASKVQEDSHRQFSTCDAICLHISCMCISMIQDIMPVPGCIHRHSLLIRILYTN